MLKQLEGVLVSAVDGLTSLYKLRVLIQPCPMPARVTVSNCVRGHAPKFMRRVRSPHVIDIEMALTKLKHFKRFRHVCINCLMGWLRRNIGLLLESPGCSGTGLVVQTAPL